MADGMQSPQLGGTQIDDAFTFDAMSPVQIENGSPLSANLGNNNNNNNGKQHSPIRDGVDDNHTKLITYNWENFVIPFNEIDLSNLEQLRHDLLLCMDNDGGFNSEISLGMTGVEILLSVLERSGKNIFSEQINILASENVDIALHNDIEGAGKLSSALTKDTVLTTAMQLQELCDKRLGELQQVNIDNNAELSRIINGEEDIEEDSFLMMENVNGSMSYSNSHVENDISVEDLERIQSMASANMISMDNNNIQKRNNNNNYQNKSSIITAIGIDNHAPAQYPLPGQWESKHYRRNSIEAIKAKEKNVWIGLNMAQHRHHVDQYLGTCDGIPMARWAGSLRDNAKYADRVKGVKPMRFSKTLGPDGRSMSSSRVRKKEAEVKANMQSTISSSDLKSAYKEMIHNPNLKTKAIEKKLRQRKNRISRILKYSQNSELGNGKYKYPKPGQTCSKFYKRNSIDAKRARQRPYVGMNMNGVRMHITTGHGDGKAASHWVGSLRDDANGANGGTFNGNNDNNNKNSEENNNSNDNVNNESETLSNGDVDDKKLTASKTGIVESKSNSNNGSQYVGNKTSALMSGVPQSMRRYKVNLTNGVTSSPSKAYILLANALATPLINEHASKFRFRDDTPHTAARLHIKATDKKIKKKETERRNRRNAYGDQDAARFKKMKEERERRRIKKKHLMQKQMQQRSNNGVS